MYDAIEFKYLQRSQLTERRCTITLTMYNYCWTSNYLGLNFFVKYILKKWIHY